MRESGPREGEQRTQGWEGTRPWTLLPTHRVPPGRKMKPLLPRVSSYLVPIQFPANPSLVLQPSVKVPLPLAASLSELARHSKRVRIAPKVSALGLLRGKTPVRDGLCFVSVEKLVNLVGRPGIDAQENAIVLEPKRNLLGTSLVVQWLRLHSPSAEGMGLIPGKKTKILHDTQHSLKKKKS